MEPVLSKYWHEKEYYDTNHKVEMCHVVPAQSPMFNHSILFKTIKDRDSMSDAELRYFIQRNFLSIMNNVFDRNIGVDYISCFQDPRFIDAFIDVIQAMQFFDSDVIVRCNLLAYHYLTLPDEKKNSNVARKYIRIGSIVNRGRLIALKKYGLPENLENLLLIARYSDFDLNICVKRLDLIMITSQQMRDFVDTSIPVEDRNPEKLASLLVDLYGLDSWDRVFPYFMLDVLPEADDNNPNTMWITDEVEEMDSFLQLAVLYVLDKLIDSSQRLRGILLNYSEGLRILNKIVKTRFSLRHLSEDYPRINSVIYYLEKDENIYVP